MGSRSKQVMEQVVYDGRRMSIVEAHELIKKVPDDFLFTTDEAAIFLRYSKSTLERWRKDGTGPEYIQPGGVGAKGTNQSIRYRKSALIEWLDKNTIGSSMEAAIRKGQTFTTIFDLAEGLPFYVLPDGSVESMVEDNAVDLVIERLGGAWNIMWLTPVEAASRRWSSLSGHQGFAGRVQQALSTMQAGIAQAIEDTDLAGFSQG